MCEQVQRMEGWYKQRDNRLYPAWAYLAPTIILRLPYSLLASVLWCCIVYYPVGLAPEASRCAAALEFDCLLISGAASSTTRPAWPRRPAGGQQPQSPIFSSMGGSLRLHLPCNCASTIL